MKKNIIAALTLLCLVWSSLWGIIKHSLLIFPPLQFIAIRLILAAFVLMLLQYILKKTILPEPYIWKRLIISSIMICIGFYLIQIVAMQFVDSGLSSILVFTMPISAALLSHFILKERLNKYKILGLISAVIGLLIILLPQWGHLKLNRSLLGQLGLIVSGFFWALTTVYAKKHFISYDKIKLTLWQMLIGGIFLLTAALVLEPVEWTVWLSPLNEVLLLYISIVGTGLAFALWNWILSQVDVFTASMSLMLIPVLSLLFGAFFWQEHIGLNIATGALFICGGIFLNVRRVKSSLISHHSIDR